MVRLGEDSRSLRCITPLGAAGLLPLLHGPDFTRTWVTREGQSFFKQVILAIARGLCPLFSHHANHARPALCTGIGRRRNQPSSSCRRRNLNPHRPLHRHPLRYTKYAASKRLSLPWCLRRDSRSRLHKSACLPVHQR